MTIPSDAGASRRGSRSSAIAVAVVAALGQGAYAQEGEEGMVLEEVLVTAERREVNLQNVPISATVLTASALDVRC